MDTARSPRDLAASLPEPWSPRVIAEVDDNYVKVDAAPRALARFISSTG